MQELADQLTSMNQDVVLVTLAGHGEDEKEFGEVTRERWLHDVFEAYEAATRKAKAQGVPVQFLGFSVGGLLGVDLVASGKAQFAKMVLLAPALRVHARSRLIRLCRIFGRSFVIRSRTPKDYRAHIGTAVAAYESLFESLDSLENSNLSVANVPALVFMDKGDELVSYSKIESFISEKHLMNWKLELLDASQSQTDPKYRHLVIDTKSLGDKEFHRLVEQIRNFL